MLSAKNQNTFFAKNSKKIRILVLNSKTKMQIKTCTDNKASNEYLTRSK